VGFVSCLRQSNGEESERRTPMRPVAGRALIGLAVLAMITSGVGQWAAVAGGKMYWTDLGIGKIQRVNLDGTGLQDLVTTGLRFPRGIAVDDSGGKIYWMDGGTLKVHRANLDGSQVEDLVTRGLSAPWGIALDVAGGKMYWTDAGTGKIQRANLDGSRVEDLSIRGLRIPWAIALDVAGGKMYWTDVGSRKIQRANLDGTGVEDLVSTYAAGPVKGGGLRYGIALTTGQ
jgi:DNA-binding beta-propeller fold protein YncE